MKIRTGMPLNLTGTPCTLFLQVVLRMKLFPLKLQAKIRMIRQDKKTGLASLCLGGGEAVAMIVKR